MKKAENWPLRTVQRRQPGCHIAITRALPFLLKLHILPKVGTKLSARIAFENKFDQRNRDHKAFCLIFYMKKSRPDGYKPHGCVKVAGLRK